MLGILLIAILGLSMMRAKGERAPNRLNNQGGSEPFNRDRTEPNDGE